MERSNQGQIPQRTQQLNIPPSTYNSNPNNQYVGSYNRFPQTRQFVGSSTYCPQARTQANQIRPYSTFGYQISNFVLDP